MANAPKPERKDVECLLWPYHFGAQKEGSTCTEVFSDDVKAIHYSWVPKPWEVGSLALLISECLSLILEKWQAVNPNEAFYNHPYFEFWRCLDNSESLRLDGIQDCNLQEVRPVSIVVD